MAERGLTGMKDPTEVYVLDKKVRLWQPAEGFRTSLDTVVLAAACPARDGDRVLDMGCGVGGAALCVQHRVPGCHITGVDIQADHIELARNNGLLNSGPGRFEFIEADIVSFNVPTPDRRFDQVICNPPYLDAGSHTPSPAAGRAAALGHLDEDVSVKSWIDSGFRLLLPGGSLTLIHRADALDRIIQALGRRFGALEIIPLWPRAGEAAKRVVVRAVKDRKTPATLHAGLVLHEANGDYTPAAQQVLRQGRALLS